MTTLILYQLYSQEQRVELTLDSLVNQTDQDFIAVIIPVAPVDALKAYAERLSEQSDNFVTLPPSNTSADSREGFPGKIVEMLLSNHASELLVFVSAGTELLPGALEMLKSCQAANSGSGIFLPGTVKSGAENENAYQPYFNKYETSEAVEQGPLRAYSVAAIQKVGGCTTHLQRVLEYDLRLRLAEQFSITYLSDPICRSRPALSDFPFAQIQHVWDPGIRLQDNRLSLGFTVTDLKASKEYDALFLAALKRRGVFVSDSRLSTKRFRLDYDDSPLVTVLMPVFNRAEYIADAVESIFRSTFTDFEILIVDNGSTDDTLKVLSPLTSDPRLRVISSGTASLSESLNIGIEEARGQIITRVDSDDLLHPEALSKHVAFLRDQPEYGGVSSYASHIDQTATILMKDDHFEWAPDANQMLRHHRLGCPDTYRTEVLRSINGYDTVNFSSWAEDYDLALRVSEKYRLGMIKECLYQYRHHQSSETAATADTTKAACREKALALAYARRRELAGEYICIKSSSAS